MSVSKKIITGSHGTPNGERNALKMPLLLVTARNLKSTIQGFPYWGMAPVPYFNFAPFVQTGLASFDFSRSSEFTKCWF